MKKIGIFLAYFPEQSIRREGLGRLLAFIVRGSLSRPDVKVTIGCPRWYLPELNELFDDHDIDPRQVDFLTTPTVPYVFRIRKWLKRRKKFRSPRAIVKRSILKFKASYRRQILALGASYDLRSASSALLQLFVLSAAALVIAIILLPLLVPVLAARIVWGMVPGRIKNLITRGASFSVHSLKGETWAQEGLDILRAQEMKRLVSSINARQDITAWFSPTIFWPEIKGIKARTTAAAPDIVMLEYPTRFATPFVERIFDRFAETALSADRLITYSEHVKRKHLVRSLGIDADKISVIRHGRTELSRYLGAGYKVNSIADIREVASEILRKYSLSNLRAVPFWRNIDLPNTPYIFYSSQIRPHKNIVSLLKLVEALNRSHDTNIRLILTGSWSAEPFLADYIHRNSLGELVHSAHDLPSEQLAAFNACATLSITPTLFEGGFPFTFCEAYSVGTPSLMSDIPVIREVLDQLPHEVADRMLFDPFDQRDLLRKTLWALDHRDELIRMQRPLFESFPSWEEVASSYVSAITEPN